MPGQAARGSPGQPASLTKDCTAGDGGHRTSSPTAGQRSPPSKQAARAPVEMEPSDVPVHDWPGAVAVCVALTKRGWLAHTRPSARIAGPWRHAASRGRRIAGERSARTATSADGATGVARTPRPFLRPGGARSAGCRVTVVADTARVGGMLGVPVRGAWPRLCSAPRAGQRHPEVPSARWDNLCIYGGL